MYMTERAEEREKTYPLFYWPASELQRLFLYRWVNVEGGLRRWELRPGKNKNFTACLFVVLLR